MTGATRVNNYLALYEEVLAEVNNDHRRARAITEQRWLAQEEPHMVHLTVLWPAAEVHAKGCSDAVRALRLHRSHDGSEIVESYEDRSGETVDRVMAEVSADANDSFAWKEGDEDPEPWPVSAFKMQPCIERKYPTSQLTSKRRSVKVAKPSGNRTTPKEAAVTIRKNTTKAAREALATTGSKSDRMRALFADGQTVSQVAKATDSHYSFVHTVYKKWLASQEAPAEKPVSARQAGINRDAEAKAAKPATVRRANQKANRNITVRKVSGGEQQDPTPAPAAKRTRRSTAGSTDDGLPF